MSRAPRISWPPFGFGRELEEDYIQGFFARHLDLQKDPSRRACPCSFAVEDDATYAIGC